MPTIEELTASFAAFDTDGDGTLTAQELTMILTREGGGSAAMSVEEATDLIKSVDVNGDGVLQIEEFCELMATPGSLTLLPRPAASAEERLARFRSEATAIKASSPVKALFEKIAAHDPTVVKVGLNMGELGAGTTALNMEFRAWTPTRRAAALALLVGNPHITDLNLAGTGLTDRCARALEAVLGAPGCCIEVLNLERNHLSEPGLLPILDGIKSNAVLRQLQLTGQNNGPLTTSVEVAIAQMLDSGGATAIVKLSPPMRNPNERRRVEAALSRNMELQRKKRLSAQQAAAAAA